MKGKQILFHKSKNSWYLYNKPVIIFNLAAPKQLGDMFFYFIQMAALLVRSILIYFAFVLRKIIVYKVCDIALRIFRIR